MTTPIEEEYRRRVEEWIEAGIGVVTSADALYELLRNTEYYAPRRIIREEWREHVRTEAYLPLIARLPEESYIPRSWIQETSAEYRENYAVKLRITGLDEITGEAKETYVTLEYPTMMMKGEVLQDAADFLRWYGFDLTFGKSQISIARVLHRRGTSW
jgi:type 1 glutamine amidotransferase